jgi:protease secretion system membrane fusion protein
MKLIKKEDLATDVVVHEVTPETLHTDPAGYSRLGWIVVLVGFVGFVLWASLAPLDRGVPLSGVVAKESNRKAVQHLQGGTIDEILVKEGDAVKAGQVLVRMNSVAAGAQAGITDIQLINARAAEARLLAERDGKSEIAFPASLTGRQNTDPRVVEAMSLQRQLFASRRLALDSELRSVDESISGIKLQLAGTEASRDSKKDQLALLKEQLANIRDLAKEGYVARSKLLELERTHAATAGAIAEDNGNIGRGRRQIAELSLKRTQREQEFQNEVRTQLAQVQQEGDALENKIKADQLILQNVEVRAPVDGVVIGLTVHTKGGIVQPGQRMMDIVPTSDALVIEGQLPVNLVDKVHPGLKVDFIFSAFNASTTPHVPGEVVTVGADRLTDERSGFPYYKVTARVTPEGARLIRERKLDIKPGMPVELFVKTGERTMMNYLFRPLVDRLKTSMSED